MSHAAALPFLRVNPVLPTKQPLRRGPKRPFECHEQRAAALFQADLFDKALLGGWR